jgi:hypothetical protein
MVHEAIHGPGIDAGVGAGLGAKSTAAATDEKGPRLKRRATIFTGPFDPGTGVSTFAPFHAADPGTVDAPTFGYSGGFGGENLVADEAGSLYSGHVNRSFLAVERATSVDALRGFVMP